MSLFQKKITDTSILPLYTLGANKTLLIIGLGNPGGEHSGTRHNIGFEVLNNFALSNEFPAWTNKKDLKGQLSTHTVGSTRVILAKPTTFMNLSGESAVAIQHFYRVYNAQTLVVYDELAIPFGSLRTRLSGSDAGHNGIKSLIQYIGDDFGRLRIGIGSELSAKAGSASFVLGKYSSGEKEVLPLVIKEACALITEYIFSGELPPDTRSVL